jgi:transcriptional regulator with XRE-family HTH domain
VLLDQVDDLGVHRTVLLRGEPGQLLVHLRGEPDEECLADERGVGGLRQGACGSLSVRVLYSERPMTVKATEEKFVNGAAKAPRTARTLRLEHLMDEAQRLQIAERIKDLRERSPYTQPNLAEKLGITLRAYQKMEANGTTKWERCEELGEIHGVDPRWIWEGEERPATPDLMGRLSSGPEAQLDRIERMLEVVLGALEELVAEGTESLLEQAEAPASSRRDKASD